MVYDLFWFGLDFLLFVILPVRLDSFDIKIWKGIASNKCWGYVTIWYDLWICVICSDMWCGVVWGYVVINDMSFVIICDDTLPKFDIALKSYLPNRKVVFQPSFFRGYVKLQGCMCWLVMICADMFCKMESNESLSRCCEKFPTITSSYLFFGVMFLRVSWLLSKVPVRPLDHSWWTTRHPFFDDYSLAFFKCHILTLPRVFSQFAPEIYRDPKGNE